MSTAIPQQQKTSSSSKASSKKVITTTQVDDNHQGDENATFITMNTGAGAGAGQQQDCVAGDNNQDSSMIMPFSQEQQQQDDDHQQQQQQQENMIMMMNMQQQQQIHQQQSAVNVVGGISSLASQQQQQENISIDRLTEQGIAQVDINKLKSAGIFTVPGIHMQCRKELNNIKGLSEAKVDKVVEAAKKLADAGFCTATKCLERRNNIPKLSTGSKDLDALLGGGIEACAITEAFGEFRTGKSQLAHTLCVTCQLPTSDGGNKGKAVFVDTEGTFRPERIKPIAERFGLDPAEVLDNILVARAFTHEHQANLISAVASKMAQDKYALLVVDSITALFRTDFSGRGELAERQQKLGKMMNQLMKVAEEFSVAVYITNQVVADPGASAMFVADPKKPVGGHIIAHASTTRLSLRKGRGENRICKIYDSPSLPETECQFSISEQGINDATSA